MTVPLTRPEDARPVELEAGEQWCPAFRVLPPVTVTSGDETEAMEELIAASQVAERNLGVIYAHASRYPSEAGTPWLDPVNDAPQVVMGFTAHVAVHRQALASELTDPDRVLICQVRHSQAELTTVAAEIQGSMATNDGAYLSVGAGTAAVEVALRADQEALAADLVGRYGDTVSVMLGNFPYPLPADLGSIDPVACRVADFAGPTDHKGLQATVTFESATVTAGADIQGTVTITNTGSEPVSFESGSPLAGAIVRPGTTTVVGTHVGVIAGAGAGATLEPGGSYDIPALFGTASCDPSAGYVVPAGDYEVLVPVIAKYPQRSGDPIVNELVTLPGSLTVVA
jgi:hypothetical protein